MKKVIWAWALSCMGCLGVASSEAQTTPIGNDFQVNFTTAGEQREAHAAADALGNYIVVWRTDLTGVFVRQVFADGTLGDEMMLEPGLRPRVARAPGGEFVVAYDVVSSPALRVQPFNASGTPIGDGITVSEDDGVLTGNPNIDVDAGGNFVVVWNTFSQTGRDILARRGSSDGTLQGGVFQVDSGMGTPNQPSVAVADSGDFAVVWTSTQSSGDDNDSTSIQGRIYASDGQPLGAPFQVNTATTDRQEQPDIAALADGSWVAVWTDLAEGATGDIDIAMQRLDSVGQLLGPQIKANTYTTSIQKVPSVAAYDEGGFVVTWESYGSPSNDSLRESVQGQIFDSQGQFVDEQFQVNSHTPAQQTRIEVATAPGQRALMVWRSGSSTGDDDSPSSVQGRRFGPFTPDVFADGFESGDVLSWSDAQP